MRAHGYCLHCRKIKRVNINPSQLNSRIPYGECDDCIDRRRNESQQRASGSSRPNPRKDQK